MITTDIVIVSSYVHIINATSDTHNEYDYDAHINSTWWKYSMLCDINHQRQSTSNVSLLLTIDANCKKLSYLGHKNQSMPTCYALF